MMHRGQAILSLGSNLGAREERLLEAVSLLEREPRVDLLGFSSLYETEPIGVPTEAPFVNAVAVIGFDGSPRSLLDLCRGLERRAGREGSGPDRPLDIDIVLFDDCVLEEPDLVLPHPRFAERLFVLVPLAEVAPGLALPPDGRTAGEMLRSGGRGGWIRRISGRSPLRIGEEAGRSGTY